MMQAPLHSSIQPNPRLADYYSGACKQFYLPLYANCRFPPSLQRMLGCRLAADRAPEEIRSSLLKAVHGHFSHVKIPFDRADSPLLPLVLAQAEELGLRVVLQFPASFWSDAEIVAALLARPKSFELEILLDGALPEGAAKQAAHFTDFYFSALVSLEFDWRAALSPEFSAAKKPLHLHFAYQHDLREPYLTCAESQRLLRRLQKALPAVVFLPPRGVDLFDRRVRPGFELEPFFEPCYATASENPAVRFSVVIPTYNNQNHLRVTIRHLLEQNVGPDAFEIIIVDDGSTDQTQSLVLELLRRENRAFNFKYIFFPREARRSMGDAQFRAGIARNLGVKNAVGEILCFLDSDIVTPPHYLRSVEETLPEWGALQARRINLTQAASHLECSYQRVREGLDTEAGETYWEVFTKHTRDWHLLPFNWKYVCTHSFSIRRDLFWKLGGFKRNFIFYGFEDTDLGYRLTKSGHLLHLLNVKVFHLYHESARSEFLNLSSLRQILLGRTAQIFFLHHLDADIFENLRGYMAPEQGLRRFLRGLGRALRLAFLWEKAPPVYETLRQIERAEPA